MSEILSVHNIETYYDLIYAVRGVSFSLTEGEITTILGTNGAGKSTILKTIMGLIDDQPEKGVIQFEGKKINHKDTEKIVKMGISYVPEGRQVFEELTVMENLQMGAYLRRDRGGINKDIQRIYDYFPILKEREKQWAGTLSGGEQQMLAISRALMSKPKLLFLDEPSLGLSPLLVKEIFEIIKLINQEGVTILLVEQNANMALGIAKKGLILESGRFVLNGSSKELLKNKDVQEFYLGIKTEVATKGYQRWKRKKSWR
ncbi:MAG: ABC transporter ATP-binding protein [Deltaproteobacteria bacterium]|nr:ABC transporter ATP-binding protein [Deltaproteobacteria bacterium]